MSKPQPELEKANLDKLIAIEWDILNDLKKMLTNKKISTAEKIRAANALAYHATVLNKLLAQKGEKPIDDMTLGHFITGVGRRYALRVRTDYKLWKKKLSSTE